MMAQHKPPDLPRRHHEQIPPPTFWSLLTAFIASATAGFVVYNILYNLHSLSVRMHAATSPTSHWSQPAAHVSHRDGKLLGLQLLLETRVCGSPAVDGYQRVNISCILQSPTAQWYNRYIIAGSRYNSLEVHIEKQADYDGLAVVWGVKHSKRSALECAKACWQHRPGAVQGPFSALPCNTFSFCNADKCFQPDAHEHSRGDCWLKFTEAPARPEVNMRGVLPDFRAKHPSAPDQVQWIAGVLLPPGVQLTSGSWSPRFYW